MAYRNKLPNETDEQYDERMDGVFTESALRIAVASAIAATVILGALFMCIGLTL